MTPRRTRPQSDIKSVRTQDRGMTREAPSRLGRVGRRCDILRGMSVRGWGGPIATAIGGAVIAGAAQLGVGYGLGIIVWHGDGPGWGAALTWTMWVGAFAVVVGGLAGRSALPAVGYPAALRTLWNVTIVVAATLGGLAIVPLTALPARS